VAYSVKQSTVPICFHKKTDNVLISTSPSIIDCPQERQTQSTHGFNVIEYQSEVQDESAKFNSDMTSLMEVNPNPDLRIRVCTLFDRNVKDYFDSLIDTGAHLNLISQEKVHSINADMNRTFESTAHYPKKFRTANWEQLARGETGLVLQLQFQKRITSLT
jgi:hypothetical protein